MFPGNAHLSSKTDESANLPITPSLRHFRATLVAARLWSQRDSGRSATLVAARLWSQRDSGREASAIQHLPLWPPLHSLERVRGEVPLSLSAGREGEVIRPTRPIPPCTKTEPQISLSKFICWIMAAFALLTVLIYGGKIFRWLRTRLGEASQPSHSALSSVSSLQRFYPGQQPITRPLGHKNRPTERERPQPEKYIFSRLVPCALFAALYMGSTFILFNPACAARLE